MAKDGTNRGGARIGAGRKSKSLNDKISEGKSAKILNTPAELNGEDVPLVREFLKAPQAKGKDLIAEEIFFNTYNWLKEHGCEKAVYSQLIEQYAMSVARWIQAEELISATGFLAKHPTTGNAIASPYINVSQTYMKQAQQIWYQIFQIVKENSSGDYSHTPMDDTMELLLSVRKGG
ncbi:MAG: P27 family phage terminase small subunit [Oscillospiraceae bacterium]|nr:P27 family phage terminase small subunit [Oscillospiraceae bacterium]